MANYSLTINSKFQPFSFERYMQPISIYAQQYENRYKELQQQALVSGLMGSMVDPELDAEVYNDLQGYNETLNRLRDEMSTVGLTPRNKGEFLNLWQQYGSKVAPIERWAALRNKDIERYDTLYAQNNGNIVFGNDPRKTSLSYYKSGRPLGLEYSNLNAALTESSKAFETLAKSYRNTEEGHAFNNDFVMFKQITGLPPEEIYQALRDSGKYPEFNKMMNSLEDKYGMNNPSFSDEDKVRIHNTLYEGASLGMASAYDEKVTIQQDPRAKQQMEDESWFARQAYSYEHDPSKQKDALEVQALLNQSTDNNPYSNLDYADAPINENVDSYVDLRSKLYRDDGILKTDYAGNSKTNGFVNPMAVYKYAKDIYDKTPAKGGYAQSNNPKTAGTYPSTNTGESSATWNDAVNKAKQHFGVKNVISKTEYDKLTKLGYNEKSTFKDFQYLNDFDKKVDKSVKRHSATNLNMSKYTKATDKAFPNLATRTYNIYEYDENTGKPKGRPKNSKEIFKYKDDANGGKVKNGQIESLDYDIRNQGYIVATVANGKKYFIPLGAFGLNIDNVEKEVINNPKYNLNSSTTTDEDWGEAQNLIALLIREKLNDYDPIASETDSKR